MRLHALAGSTDKALAKGIAWKELVTAP